MIRVTIVLAGTVAGLMFYIIWRLKTSVADRLAVCGLVCVPAVILVWLIQGQLQDARDLIVYRDSLDQYCESIGFDGVGLTNKVDSKAAPVACVQRLPTIKGQQRFAIVGIEKGECVRNRDEAVADEI